MGLGSEIVKSIRRALHGIQPDARIYSRSVMQGIQLPCFIVRILNTDAIERFRKRFFYNFHFSIVYIQDNPTHEDLSDMIEQLMFTFDSIIYTHDETFYLRANEMNAEIVDDTVVFTGIFSINVRKEIAPEDYMEIIEEINQYTRDPDASDDAYTEVTDPIKNPDPDMWRPIQDDEYEEDESGYMEKLEGGNYGK